MDVLLERADDLAQRTLVNPYNPIDGRVAYVVSHGQSYASNGYAIRTQGVAKALNAHGFEMLCFVRPGRPWELGAEVDSVSPEKVVDGVRYFHSRWQTGCAPNGELEHLDVSVKRLIELFRVYRPAAVVAASNYIVGLPAWVAAKRLGLPFYNEVRGFWELSRAAREPGYENAPAFRTEAQRDAFVGQKALTVFTLNQTMKDELVKRGIDSGKVKIVPNAVTDLPEIKSANSELLRKLGIDPEDKVVGYIGSFSEYEGLDVLFEACANLVDRGERIKLLLVGDDQPITNATTRKNAQADKPWLIQVGRIPHDQVAEYYALIDAVVIPRKRLPVCELVPPMKIVEALAFGKQVVVSDVAPLMDATFQSENVATFTAGNANSLATTLRKSLRMPRMLNRDESVVFSQSVLPLVAELKARRDEVKVDQADMQVSESAYRADAKPKPNSQKLKPAKNSNRIGVLFRPEMVELPSKDPLWHTVTVQAGQNLIVEAASEYQNTNGAKERKAVLLVRSFDAKGNEVDKPCGKLAKSGHLKAYFKYLPCTQNQLQELHSFTVPDGVSEIRLGLCGFNQQHAEQVFVRDLSVKPKPDKTQPTQFLPPSVQAAEISILGWPEYPPNGKPYVMGIMDEFTTGCFEQDVNLIQPRPDNWYALAEKYRPEFFFIESAWKGNYGSWQYRVADYANKPGHEVAHICQYAREKGIPTLFWNKEDPVHHEKFMCSAKLVDHIFTTDANMQASYLAKTGNPNIHALPFAAQPALHKPAPLAGRHPRSCFAGSWYGNRHAERGQAMGWLLQSANRHGLDIYDRNYGTGIFPFPEDYQAGIKGSLPYKELCDEYNRYRVFLNVNSVTDSPTMFSRRVFELMACGTPVVSTYAKGIDNLFESDAVWMVNSQDEADEAIRVLMTDDTEWRRRSLAGIREVFAKHTYAHRLNDIFTQLGIETRMPTDPTILLLAKAQGKTDLDALHQFANRQSYCAFRLGVECAQSIAGLAGSLADSIEILQPGEGAAWIAERQTDAPIAGWLSPGSYYGEHYLRDLANASLYEPNAIGWGKSLDRDLFAYGGQTMLSGTVWKTAEFLKHHLNSHREASVTSAGLYLADSDQFQSVGLTQQQVVGV